MLFSMEKEIVSLLIKTLSDLMVDNLDIKIKLQVLEERLKLKNRELYSARIATLRKLVPPDASDQALSELRTKLLQG